MTYEEQVVRENPIAITSSGRRYPLGATLINGGANSSVFSAGVPIFVMGDEVRRSERGNTNAYCQDNDTGALREIKPARHGVKLNQPDWSSFSHRVAIGGESKTERVSAHIILNTYWEPLGFELPVLPEGRGNWWRWIDTALDPPHEICEWNAEQPVLGTTYRAGARSIAVLISGDGPTPGTPAEVQSTPTEVTWSPAKGLLDKGEHS
jgi:glycogen operon protein